MTRIKNVDQIREERDFIFIENEHFCDASAAYPLSEIRRLAKLCSKVSISAASRSCFPPLPPKSMLSSPVEAVAASQQASMQHHSTLILGGGGPSKSGKRAKCSLCGRNSQEVGFPLADLLYSHRKNAYFRINKIALLPMVEHFSQLFLSLLLPPVILWGLLEGAEGRKKNIAALQH